MKTTHQIIHIRLRLPLYHSDFNIHVQRIQDMIERMNAQVVGNYELEKVSLTIREVELD